MPSASEIASAILAVAGHALAQDRDAIADHDSEPIERMQSIEGTGRSRKAEVA
jgi:hypothetical protein